MKKILSLWLALLLSFSAVYAEISNDGDIYEQETAELFESEQDYSSAEKAAEASVLLPSAAKTVYYQSLAQTNYTNNSSNTDSVTPLSLSSAPITENFTFETDIMMNSSSSAQLKLNLYSNAGASARVICLSFGLDYMSADNVYNNMWGKTAQLPYDTGANGDEWSYVMLPGLSRKGEWKNIKIYFDFSKKTYDLYIDNYLAAPDVYFTDENAVNVASAELVAAQGTVDYSLKNTALTSGYNGLFVKPASVTDSSGKQVAKLTAGATVTAKFSALKSEGADINFELKLNGAGKGSKALTVNETWQEFSADYTPAGSNDNIYLGGYDAGGNVVFKESGFIQNPKNKSNVKIFAIGDSTFGPYTGAVGWGEVFGRYLKNTAEFRRFGRSGTSTRTYMHSGRPLVIGSELTEGDFLFFQLAHNDAQAAGTGTGVKNTTIAEYKEYLRKYIIFARQKGAKLIFITPPTQRTAGSTDQFTVADNATALYPYVSAMKETAVDYDIPVVDLYTKSRDGFKLIRANEGNVNRLYIDGTHFSEDGAKLLSDYIFDGLNLLTNGIMDFLQPVSSDKSELQALYDANISKTTGYTGASFSAFSSAMAAAAAILSSSSATQDEVDAQVKKLTAAVNGLIPGREDFGVITKDTYIQIGKGDNHGTEATFVIKHTINSNYSTSRIAYIEFNIAAIDENSPEVVFNIYQTGSAGSDWGASWPLRLYKATGTFSETTLNNNNKSTVTIGEQAATASIDDYNNLGYATFNVTDYVKERKKAAQNTIIFIIGTSHGSDSGTGIQFHSRESDEAGKRPVLLAAQGIGKPLGEAIKEDLDAIDIGAYTADGDTINGITKSLKTLPSKGSKNNYDISWKSSDLSIMSDSGAIVKLPSADTSIVMTAVIKSDGVTHTKSFNLTVLMDTTGWTDMDYVNYDLSLLNFSDFCAQNPAQIVSDITLPQYRKADWSQYTWASDNAAAVIKNNLTASFIPADDSETSLNITVTARYKTASGTKTFPLTIIRGFSKNLVVTEGAEIKASGGNAAPVSGRDFESYWVSPSVDKEISVTFKFKKPQIINAALFVERGNAITEYKLQYLKDGAWVDLYVGAGVGDRKREAIDFDDTEVMSVRFIVTKTRAGAANVSLYTAELYDATISDERCVKADLDSLTIPKIITSNINFPAAGAKGSKFTFVSSDTSYVTNTGVVTRPTGQNEVGLTIKVTASKGSASAEKIFTVSVPPVFGGSVGTGGTGGTGGGRVSGGGGAVAAMPAEDARLPIADNGNNTAASRTGVFSDVEITHWAYGYIDTLAEKGVINGSDGKFNPSGSITREEFIKMAVISGGIELVYDGADFDDVDRSEWYYPYIAAAYNAGVTNGLGDGKFGVGQSISRQDMAVMACRLLEKYKKLSDNDNTLNYSDNDDIARYALDSVKRLAGMKIMNGNEKNEFLPRNNTARAEAAKIIFLVLYNI